MKSTAIAAKKEKLYQAYLIFPKVSKKILSNVTSSVSPVSTVSPVSPLTPVNPVWIPT